MGRSPPPQPAPTGNTITAVFSEDGFIFGLSGCNQFSKFPNNFPPHPLIIPLVEL